MSWSSEPMSEDEVLAMEHDHFQLAAFGREVVAHEALLRICGDWAT